MRTDATGAEVTMTIRVFLVEDHALLRELLRRELEQHDEIVVAGESGTAEEARVGIRETRPDVVLQDIKLPDGDGVEICRDIRSELPEVRFVILSGFTDDVGVLSAIMAGASGYLLKSTGTEEVLAAIRTVAAGGSLLDPAVTGELFERLRQRPGGDPLESLTGQERTVLTLIGEGLTNREIATRMFLSEKTIRNYVSNVLAKLRLPHRTSAALYAAEIERAGGRRRPRRE